MIFIFTAFYFFTIMCVLKTFITFYVKVLNFCMKGHAFIQEHLQIMLDHRSAIKIFLMK